MTIVTIMTIRLTPKRARAWLRLLAIGALALPMVLLAGCRGPDASATAAAGAAPATSPAAATSTTAAAGEAAAPRGGTPLRANGPLAGAAAEQQQIMDQESRAAGQ